VVTEFSEASEVP
jgi:hypothetical protein